MYLTISTNNLKTCLLCGAEGAKFVKHPSRMYCSSCGRYKGVHLAPLNNYNIKNPVEMIDFAISVANDIHRGQFRRDKIPYIEHVQWIASQIEPTQTHLTTLAWLHDCLEDGSIDMVGLKRMLPKQIYTSLIAITKVKNETYEQYISRVLIDEDATTIKILDTIHNLTDNPSERQKTKYRLSLVRLTQRKR